MTDGIETSQVKVSRSTIVDVTVAALTSVRPTGLAAAQRRIPLGLIWTLIRTDFKTRYHGTLSGFAWALLKPVTMFIVLMGVFSFLFTDPAYKLNLIIGLFLWDFFGEATKVGLTSLHAKGFLLSKARCPSWILVITSVSNAVITLVVFFAIIVVFLTFGWRLPSAAMLGLFALYCVALIGIVIGFALGSSVLFLRYRDLNQVWDVLMQAGLFIGPIIYPIGIIPERFHFYLYLWPPTPIIEFSRDVLVRGVIPTRTAHVYLALDAMLILGLGTMVFRWLAPRAAEYV
jgi:homopolymeric O-antigen transport system permease protein